VRWLHAYFGAVALLVYMGAVCAQSNPTEAGLTTDRAEFTVTTDVVGDRVLQMEMGALEEISAGSRLLHGPCPLVRIGIGNNVEVRVGGDGFLASTGRDSLNAKGMSDLSVGVKWKLANETRFIPAIALNPSISAPAGSRQFTSSGYDPTLRLALAKRLPAGFRASGNLNASSLTDGRRFLQRGMSLCIEHDLPARFVAYGEVYTLSALDRHGAASTMFNTGLFHGLGKRMQLDVEAGHRLSDCGPAWFAGVGFVVRFDGWREH